MNIRFGLALLMGGLLVLGLTGCKPEEQGRILKYQKGVYLGKADTPLAADQKETLRDRTRYQAGVDHALILGGGRQPDIYGSSVRPPASAVNTDTLRERVSGQRF